MKDRERETRSLLFYLISYRKSSGAPINRINFYIDVISRRNKELEKVNVFKMKYVYGNRMKTCKAQNAFNLLRKTWVSNELFEKTKLRIFKSNNISMLLYGSET